MKTTISEMVKNAQKNTDKQIILTKVNNRLHEINNRQISDEKVEYITTDTTIGNETYKRSVVFLMLNAISKIAPGHIIKNVCVEYSISKGIYCDVKGGYKITEEFIEKLKRVMNEDVKKNLPITKTMMKKEEAIELFKKLDMQDKVKLFTYRLNSYVNVYKLENYFDYFYGYMAPSTGMLGVFDIIPYNEGFILMLPTAANPDKLEKFEPQNKVFNVLKSATNWADMLGLGTVGDLNEHITRGNINASILAQEAIQEQRIVEIVKQIQQKENIKFVMIAGPSSSGKTTFANRLSIQLLANGFKPHPISVDNYFVEREQTPKDENGNYNFEDLRAIDVELFNNQMNSLLKGEAVDLPTFNFKIGRKEYNGNTLRLGREDILVIEGIHCLNDELSYTLPVDSKFKIYISALTQLNVDEHNRVSTTDGRLIRRLVRDYRTRGASAQRTLEMWSSVKKGEEKNIFPYQEYADAMFNSAMAYEISVLKPFVEPLLYSVREDSPVYFEAKRLLKFIDYFLPCSLECVPIDSIIREFTGGGCFKV